MNRGEERFFTRSWLPIGFGVRRSSDGLWERDGKLLPWLWVKGPEDGARVYSLKLGEYMLSMAILTGAQL